jgi:hypothetical protein
MSFTITDQGQTTNTTGSPLTLTTATSIPAGSTIVVITYEKNAAGTTGTVSDSAGNVYTKEDNVSPAATNTDGRGAIWFVTNCLGPVTSISYTKQTTTVNAYMGALSATAGGPISLDTHATPVTGTGTTINISVTGTSGTEWYVFGFCTNIYSAGDITAFTQASGFNNGFDVAQASGGGTGGGGGNRTGTGTQTWNSTFSSVSRAFASFFLVFKEGPIAKPNRRIIRRYY